jgi:hypothetical protein
LAVFRSSNILANYNFPLIAALGVQGVLVQVSYENNLDDLISLNIDLMANNEQFKKRRLLSLYITPVFLLFAFSFFSYVTDNPSFYGGAVVGSLVSYLWTYYGYKKYPRKAAEELRQIEVFCEHTLVITEDGVKESTNNSESFHKWNAIDHVSVNDNYVFIYNTPMTAHVIPKRVIGENDFVQITEMVAVYKTPNKKINKD